MSTDTGGNPDAATSAGLRWCPRAGVRVQLFSAATMWLIGSGILIIRGFMYVWDTKWHAWVAAGLLATAIAIPKSRYLLDRVAAKAVARIRVRGRACYFGFFSWRSWLLVALMMGSGMMLRRVVGETSLLGSAIMGALYLGIGFALFIADRVFWLAAFDKHLPYDLDEVVTAPALATGTSAALTTAGPVTKEESNR